MKKLDAFWRHSDCTVTTKIQVADAVLRAKLLYGMESAQLTPAVVKRLETFQLKVLRKILNMKTTYIDRANTNDLVFRTANEKIGEDAEGSNKRKKIVTFVEAYKRQKVKRACKVIRQEGSAIHKVSFSGNKLRKWIHRNRRVGRPRLNWTEETIKELWDTIKKKDPAFRFQAFDGDNETIINKIKRYAESYDKEKE